MDTTIADPLVGRLLDGRYAVERRIARGGMASVYLATDTRLQRPVAVKVMHPALADDDAFVARFTREARAAAALSHPNVVAVFDQGTDGETVYLVMEYVAGNTLRDLLRERGRLPVGQAVTLTEQVLAALAAAHRAGLVHRDVKPENVLLSDDGQVKVADFGLARAIAEAHLTSTTVVIGTAAYLAPEQFSRGVADARSDVYSAGILLYELLTGAPPFGGDTPQAIASAHVNRDVPAPSAQVPGIPPELNAAVLAATAREPADRPADAAVLLQRLRGLGLEEEWVPDPQDTVRFTTPIPAGGTRVVPRPPTARGRRRRWPWVAALVALLTAGAAAAGWWLAIGRTIPVPKLVGMSVTSARSTAHHLHLRLVVASGVYTNTVSTGLIASQSPSQHQRVDSGGTVTVHPSLGPVDRPVPGVLGAPLAAAEAELAKATLKSEVAPAQYSSQVPAGDVIATSPGPGAMVRHGSTVTLIPSKGPAPVAVPSVTGEPVSQAEATLKGAGLIAATNQVYSSSVPAGQVMAQNPPSGASVPPGSTVTLTVSKGPRLFAVPNVQGDDVQTAVNALQQAGFTPDVRELPGGPGIVLKQSPGAGAMRPHGATVVLYVF